MQLRFPASRSLFTGLLVALGLPLALTVGGLVGAFAQEVSEPPEGWKLSGDADRVRSTYETYCATCHGAEGHGDGVMAKFLEPKPKDLTNTEYMDTRSDYELYLAIKEGGAAVGLSDKMAPWKQLLAEQEIQDLTLLVRELSHGS